MLATAGYAVRRGRVIGVASACSRFHRPVSILQSWFAIAERNCGDFIPTVKPVHVTAAMTVGQALRIAVAGARRSRSAVSARHCSRLARKDVTAAVTTTA